MTRPVDYENLLRRIRRIGTDITPETIVETAKLYYPLLIKAPREGVIRKRNLPYGPHERHRLDLYLPDLHENSDMTNMNASAEIVEPINSADEVDSMPSLPIVVFVHGGGFTSGDKQHLNNIGFFLARNGMIAVLPNYRLAPKHTWPAGAEDVGAVVEWLRENGTELGGNRDQIFLMGHSAGASHVAGYLFIKQLQPKEKDGVIGTILVSGPDYDPKLLEPGNPAHLYYGDDPSQFTSRSVVNDIQRPDLAVFLVSAELDPPLFDHQLMTLMSALFQRDGVSPFVKKLCRHNHFSEVFQINSSFDTLGPDILYFIKTTAEALFAERIFPKGPDI